MRKILLLFAMLMGLLSSALAQTKTVTGRVVDETGAPVPYATVVVKGTVSGVAADEDGVFSITFVGNRQLEISATNFETVTITPVVGENVVTLKHLGAAIDEVVITAYGTAKKSSYTGSIATIDASKIGKFQAPDVARALEGAVAGLTVVNTTGQPGSSSTLRIRGIGSINASSAPLIILDGVPYSGSINSINPYDIQSVNVLKDAASAALYGARGANGVIIITTKKGKAGAPNISVDIKGGVNSRAIPDYDRITDVGQYYETFWLALYNSALFSLLKSDGTRYTEAEARAYASRNLYTVLGYNAYKVPNDQIVLENGKLNPDAVIKYKDKDWNNWDKALFKPSARQEYNITLNEVNDKSKFYLSLGYLDDQGYAKNSYFKRFSSRMGYDSKLFPWLDFGAGVQYSNTKSNWLSSGSAYSNPFQWVRSISPIYPIYKTDADGNTLYDQNGNPIYDFGEAVAGVNGGRAYGAQTNPVATQLHDLELYKNDFFIGNTRFDVALPFNLTFNTNFALTGIWGQADDFITPLGGSGATYNGIGSKSRENSKAITWNQILKWDKSFNLVTLQAMIGHETYNYKYNYLYGQKQNFLDPENIEFANAAQITELTSYTRDYLLEGYFGQVTSDIAKKYFFSASIRRDGSSVFHPDHRWGTFWSVGASWLLNKESFLASSTIVDVLKLKASYGLQGNDYLYLPNSTTRSYTPYHTLFQITSDGTNAGLSPRYKGRKEVTWEKNYNFNVGIEFSLLRGVVSGEIEYFQRRTKDLLFNLPVSTATGFTTEPWNIGDMRNRGIEVTLSSDIINRADVLWNVSVNATHYKNKVTYLPEQFRENGITRGSQIIKVGGSIYDFYLIKYRGVNPTNGAAIYQLKNTAGQFVDSTLTGTIDASSNRQYAGSALPKLAGGFSTNFRYKTFDASVTFSYQIGGKILDQQYANLMNVNNNDGRSWSPDILNTWTPTNTNTSVPRIEYNNQYMVPSFSDRFLTDASFLSLRNVNVGYNFGSKFFGGRIVKNARLYIAADNVWLGSKRKGLDPRTNLDGLNNGALYSAIRTVVAGLTINL